MQSSLVPSRPVKGRKPNNIEEELGITQLVFCNLARSSLTLARMPHNLLWGASFARKTRFLLIAPILVLQLAGGMVAIAMAYVINVIQLNRCLPNDVVFNLPDIYSGLAHRYE